LWQFQPDVSRPLSHSRIIGDYQILEPIGEGGMGQVYLAENIHHRKKYALKILPEQLSRDKGFRQRFFDEARVMSELDHPHIVRVHHIGECQGLYYLVMDYMEGPEGRPCSLHQYLKTSPNGRLEENIAIPWILQIAEGLVYAHQRGVIHRDIKPANILLTRDGRIRITDFGLAKAVGAEFIQSQIHTTQHSFGSTPTIHKPITGEKSIGSWVTTTGDNAPSRRSSESSGILGTYDYMSPEHGKMR
jgi:serine/threonine protein kinase